MTQLSLLPIRLRDEFEADRTKSKDLLWTGFDEQDRRYALKTCEPANPALPLTEWICYHLCLLCGIPAPDFAIVTRKDGSQAFGSRWEDDVDELRKDETAPAEFALWIDSTRDDLSAMFALDCFLPNSDRHMGNVLFRRGPRRRALAFDWSRTQLFEPWPLAPNSNTLSNLGWLRHTGFYSAAAWNAVLEKLAHITHTDLRQLLDSAPDEWCATLSKDILEDWWKTHRHARLDSLK
jgi:hypothetical protein